VSGNMPFVGGCPNTTSNGEALIALCFWVFIASVYKNMNIK
jgi:hypothetical protein